MEVISVLAPAAFRQPFTRLGSLLGRQDLGDLPLNAHPLRQLLGLYLNQLLLQRRNLLVV